MANILTTATTLFTNIGTAKLTTIIVGIIIAIVVLFKIGFFTSFKEGLMAYIFKDRSIESVNRQDLKRWFNKDETDKYKKDWFEKE